MIKYLQYGLYTAILVAVSASAIGTANSAEQFPWGQAESQPVITPGNSQYANSNGNYGAEYDSRYQNGQSRTGERTYGANEQFDPNEGSNPQQNTDPYRTYDDYISEQAPEQPYSAPVQPSRPAAAPSHQRTRRQQQASPQPYEGGSDDETFSDQEILNAGHRAFGQVTASLAKVIEYAFQKAGRPNGYIIGQEAGGAFIAGLRYGEGTLHTKNAGRHKIFWQGPSIGYDFGAEGSRTMILVYNLAHTDDIYRRFAGIDGSAYFVGGVGLTFQSGENVTLAPIRSGVGLRLGANVGYLKYTRRPSWNPF